MPWYSGWDSTRMGFPKASLQLGDSSLVGAVIGVLRPLFRQLRIVARDRSLEELGVPLLLDGRSERGPLVGLARGLAASDALWSFVVGCDMPFLQAGVIRCMAERLKGCEALVVDIGGNVQFLHAFYARECLPYAESLLDAGTTSLRALVPLCKVGTLGADDFLDIDPDLLSFRDLDTAEEYDQAVNLQTKT